MAIRLPFSSEINFSALILCRSYVEATQRLRCARPICSPKSDAHIWPPQFVLLSMNDYSQPGAGKISVHGNGVGVPSPETVEKRAREIALIDERDPNEFTDADWEQARQELLGTVLPLPPEEPKENADLVEEWEIVANDRGHRVPRPGIEEDETLGEQLVTGGNEEAAHDQMLEARKEELEQEGGIT